MRATLLATFLMKGQPTELSESFRKQFMGLPVERLTQEFTHQFPALFDDGNRSKWAPHNFTDPRMLKELSDIREFTNKKPMVPNYKFIVHNLKRGASALTNPESVLSGRWAISASVLSNKKPVAFTNHGLILEVPENNILTTSPTDQWFDNYAVGAKELLEKGRPEKSVKAADSHTMAQHIMEKSLFIGGLLTPDEVIDRQNTPANSNHNCGAVPTKHNEVIVCGRPDEILPHGKTGKVRLLGVFVQIYQDGSFPDFYFKSSAKRAEIRQAVRKCADTFKVPMLYLPTTQMT